jgi:hypothetical protein
MESFDRASIKAYKAGSRLPEHIAAYNKYMREYMPNYRRGIYGKRGKSVSVDTPYRPRKEV